MTTSPPLKFESCYRKGVIPSLVDDLLQLLCLQFISTSSKTLLGRHNHSDVPLSGAFYAPGCPRLSSGPPEMTHRSRAERQAQEAYTHYHAVPIQTRSQLPPHLCFVSVVPQSVPWRDGVAPAASHSYSEQSHCPHPPGLGAGPQNLVATRLATPHSCSQAQRPKAVAAPLVGTWPCHKSPQHPWCWQGRQLKQTQGVPHEGNVDLAEPELVAMSTSPSGSPQARRCFDPFQQGRGPGKLYSYNLLVQPLHRASGDFAAFHAEHCAQEAALRYASRRLRHSWQL
jgi:hypothetical protein